MKSIKKKFFENKWPENVIYKNGFILQGTPLGLGVFCPANLIFLPHLDSDIPKISKRILATPFLEAAILKNNKTRDVLALNYNRKIRLGRMDLELLPSGLGEGSAQALVTCKKEKILFLAGVSQKEPVTGQKVTIPSCSVVILDTIPAASKSPSPKNEKLKLIKWIKSTRNINKTAVCVCHSKVTAINIFHLVKSLNIPVRACRTIYEIIKKTHQFDNSNLPVKRLEQTIKGTGIIIHLSKLWVKSNFEKNKNIKVAFAGPLLKRKIKSDITFRFGEGEDRSGLVSYVKKTGAKKIALCPKIDNKTVRLFLKHGFEVYKVNTPRQMLMGY